MSDEDELQSKLEGHEEPEPEEQDLGVLLFGNTSTSINLLSDQAYDILTAARLAEENGDLEEAEMLYSQARQKWQT